MRSNVPIRLHRQRGQAVIEAAFMIAIVFTVVFWLFELCWLMYTYTVISDAANEGARYAIVHCGGDTGGTQTRVSNFAKTSMHDVTALTTSVTFPDGDASPPHRVLVKVTYTYVPYVSSWIPAPTMSVSAEGRMVVPACP